MNTDEYDPAAMQCYMIIWFIFPILHEMHESNAGRMFSQSFTLREQTEIESTSGQMHDITLTCGKFMHVISLNDDDEHCALTLTTGEVLNPQHEREVHLWKEPSHAHLLDIFYWNINLNRTTHLTGLDLGKHTHTNKWNNTYHLDYNKTICNEEKSENQSLVLLYLFCI